MHKCPMTPHQNRSCTHVFKYVDHALVNAVEEGEEAVRVDGQRGRGQFLGDAVSLSVEHQLLGYLKKREPQIRIQ